MSANKEDTMTQTNETDKPYYLRPDLPNYARHDEYIRCLINENKRRIELLEKQVEEIVQLVKAIH